MRIPSSAALFLCLLLHMTAPAAPAAAAHQTPFGADNCSPRPEAKRIESRAICPFTTTVDVNATRIPTHLPVVKCNCAYSLCSPQGDYRCKEFFKTQQRRFFTMVLQAYAYHEYVLFSWMESK
ncbi:hypothetical protein V5799_033140 [Amblyomma americanum]|uniref:Secreted protein n=1 Tax=Amblyomma americanum TaxID=6943 RepID=A0AAQ4DP60_AMBAM